MQAKQTMLMKGIKMSSKVGKWKSISRFISASFRCLIRARNFYVKSCSDCAADVSVTLGLVGYPKYSEFPRNGGDDFRHLSSRAASSPTSTESERKSELHILRSARQSRPMQSHSESAMRREVRGRPVVARSRRRMRSTVVAFGRIDENEPYDPSGEDIKLMADQVFPSCTTPDAIAIANRRRVSRRSFST